MEVFQIIIIAAVLIATVAAGDGGEDGGGGSDVNKTEGGSGGAGGKDADKCKAAIKAMDDLLTSVCGGKPDVGGGDAVTGLSGRKDCHPRDPHTGRICPKCYCDCSI